MLDLRAIDDRENTCAERVFPRYEPSGPSFKLIINLGGRTLKMEHIIDSYDIALRDFGLALGALALARLSHAFDNAARCS